MLKIAVVVLLGRGVDLCTMIFPPVTGNTPVFGLPEIATIVGLSCLVPLFFLRSCAAADAVPVNDPWLAAPDTPADRIETQRHEHYCKRFAQGCFD